MSSWSLLLLVLLPFAGFCLVWYRLRGIDEQVGKLEAVSVYDPLTGLRSGRLFESECAILCRSPSPIAVLLIDLDDFRRFNDRGYREEGDRVLKRAAQVLSEKLRRRADRLYRLHTAGDEFVLFLAVETARQAHQQAERLRAALSSVKTPCSIGLAYADDQISRDPAQLLRLATTNKNAAKKRGGNCVFPPPDEPPPPPVPVSVERSRPYLVTAHAGSGGRP